MKKIIITFSFLFFIYFLFCSINIYKDFVTAKEIKHLTLKAGNNSITEKENEYLTNYIRNRLELKIRGCTFSLALFFPNMCSLNDYFLKLSIGKDAYDGICHMYKLKCK